MSGKKTDFRLLRARREAALEQHALVPEPKPAAPSEVAIAAAVAEGRFQKIPPRRRRR